MRNDLKSFELFMIVSIQHARFFIIFIVIIYCQLIVEAAMWFPERPSMQC